MQIAIYAISLNEGLHVERFMEACKDADHIVIADTGSTDRSPAMFRDLGATVHTIGISPWRFDDARNASLALVPTDVDVCFCLDIDEIPAPGWRDNIENVWVPGVTMRGEYNYIWSHNEDGSPGVQFLNAKMHSRHGYRWRHPCHEALYPDRISEVRASIPDLRVDHWPDASKSRGSYLGLLQTAVREEPHEPRNAHYLAREYYYYGRHDEAIAEFQRYLDMQGGFLEERAGSMVYIGRCLAAQGKDPLPWYHRAIAELPTMREPWVAFAEACYLKQDWANCFAAATTALSIPRRPGAYMNEPRCYGATPDDLAALGAWYIGLHAEAIEHARAALRHAPDDTRLRDNLDFMERHFAEPPADLALAS